MIAHYLAVAFASFRKAPFATAANVFTLGASTWSVQEITRDQVRVTPAPGQVGKLPFWRGDRPGRSFDLGRRMGALVRAIDARLPAALPGAPAPPSADALADVRHRNGEEVALGRREIYVHYGDGMADSRLVIPAAKAGTARNLNTVAKLVAMAGA